MTALLVTILGLVIGILKIALVVGLVVGSVVAAKKYLFGDEKIDFSFKTKEKPSKWVCSCCNAAQEAVYKFCPNCGTAKEEAADKTTEKAVTETA